MSNGHTLTINAAKPVTSTINCSNPGNATTTGSLATTPPAA